MLITKNYKSYRCFKLFRYKPNQCSGYIKWKITCTHCCQSIFNNTALRVSQEFNEFRAKCGLLWSYDWISIPLAYTQVIRVANNIIYYMCFARYIFLFARRTQNSITMDLLCLYIISFRSSRLRRIRFSLLPSSEDNTSKDQKNHCKQKSTFLYRCLQ